MKNFCISLILVWIFAGCAGMVHNDINDKGEFVGNKLEWPKIKDSNPKNGIIPTRDSLALLSNNMNKDNLYQLIGRPHYAAGFGAKEWNYLFKLKNEDGSQENCQLKILFDKDNIARSFYWNPKTCLKSKSLAKKNSSIQIDNNFAYNSFALNKEAKAQIQKLAKKLISYKNISKIVVIGYTDYIGSYNNNLILAQKRANAVLKELVKQGVKVPIKAVGEGKQDLVVICDEKLSKNELIKCLALNRRVVIKVIFNDKNL